MHLNNISGCSVQGNKELKKLLSIVDKEEMYM